MFLCVVFLRAVFAFTFYFAVFMKLTLKLVRKYILNGHIQFLDGV